MWLYVSGLITGGISAFFTMHKVYTSEIWEVKQKIKLAELRARQEKIELEIEESITERIRSGSSDYTFSN